MHIIFMFNGQPFNNPTQPEHVQFQTDITRRLNNALEIIKDKVNDKPTASITVEYSNFERYDNMRVNGFGMATTNVLIALDGF